MTAIIHKFPRHAFAAGNHLFSDRVNTLPRERPEPHFSKHEKHCRIDRPCGNPEGGVFRQAGRSRPVRTYRTI